MSICQYVWRKDEDIRKWSRSPIILSNIWPIFYKIWNQIFYQIFYQIGVLQKSRHCSQPVLICFMHSCIVMYMGPQSFGKFGHCLNFKLKAKVNLKSELKSTLVYLLGINALWKPFWNVHFSSVATALEACCAADSNNVAVNWKLLLLLLPLHLCVLLHLHLYVLLPLHLCVLLHLQPTFTLQPQSVTSHQTWRDTGWY